MSTIAIGLIIFLVMGIIALASEPSRSPEMQRIINECDARLRDIEAKRKDQTIERGE